MFASGFHLNFKVLFLIFVVAGLAIFLRVIRGQGPAATERASAVRNRISPALKAALQEKGLKLGAPVFIRIFKESKELELWVRDEMGGRYTLFRTWSIATYGFKGLGPKLKEGDGMAPEGFYHVSSRQMHPASKYHLAFNLGYPNAFDRAHGRTGSALMVHGSDISIGCYAMTDPVIEIIYIMAESALKKGQGEFQVQCFPFRMTPERLKDAEKDPNYDFWLNLKEGHDIFAKERVPPLVGVAQKRYMFRKMEP